MKEAAAQPGTVIRRSRETVVQHLAVGGPSKATPTRSAGAKSSAKASIQAQATIKPRRAREI